MRPNRTWCGRRVTRLPAGGRRIRTAGPPVKRDGVFRDHPDRPVAPSPPRESSDILARGTEGSNPSSSSGESATNCSGGGLRWSSACSLPQLTSDSSAWAALNAALARRTEREIARYLAGNPTPASVKSPIDGTCSQKSGHSRRFRLAVRNSLTITLPMEISADRHRRQAPEFRQTTDLHPRLSCRCGSAEASFDTLSQGGVAMRLEGKVAVIVGAGQSPGEGIGNGRATTLPLCARRRSDPGGR